MVTIEAISPYLFTVSGHQCVLEGAAAEKMTVAVVVAQYEKSVSSATIDLKHFFAIEEEVIDSLSTVA